MIDRIKRIPEVRFSNFSNEWQEKKLGDLGETYTGLSGKTKNDFGFGDSHFITYMNVFKNNIAKFEMTEKVKISNNEKQNKVNYGDIFFTTSSEVPQEVGMTSIWLFKTNNVYLNSFCFGFRITINNVLPIFLARYLRSENIRKKITILAQGSTRFNLSKKEVMKLSINFPEINEQQKIGDFFSKLDRQIELEEQKLAKLEEQKKGYMQQIFSQQLRFKDENGNDYPNWIFEELNNIFTKYQNTIYLHDNEEYKRISISNKGKITHRDITLGKRIGRKRQYLIDLKKHPNTLTFIRQGVFLGGIGFIPSSLDGYIVTENMPLLSMSEEYSKKFMTYLFSSESYYKSVIFKNLPTGSAQKALHEKDWLKSFVNIPVYSEQEKIGNFFEKQDNLIKKQSDKVELLKERKKGFLQKMFV